MAPGIATPEEAYSAFITAWPAIVDECRAVLGSEQHYQAMVYQALRMEGGVPRDQLGMNVKIWLEGYFTKLFRELDEKKHPDFRGGFEPVPDVAIFHKDIKGDWRRRRYRETAKHLLLAVEVKASEREKKRLGPREIISDIEKLDAFRKELWHRAKKGRKIIPVMLVLDTAPLPEERMTESALDEVQERASTLNVRFFYCGVSGCIAPPDATTAVNLIEPMDSGKGVA